MAMEGTMSASREPVPLDRRRRRRSLVAAGTIVGALVVGLSACTDDGRGDGEPGTRDVATGSPSGPVAPSDPPAGQRARVGESVAIADDDGTELATVTITDVSASQDPIDGGRVNPENGWFVTVSISVTATDADPDGYFIDRFNWSLRTVDGVGYDSLAGNVTDAMVEGEGDQIRADTVEPGHTGGGIITFDFPDEHGDVVLAPFEPGDPMPAPTAGTWEF